MGLRYNHDMLAQLLIHADTERRAEKAEKILGENNLSRSHPDLLWFEAEDKLGVEQAKQIREFLSLKPYQGNSHAVVLPAAENLTPDAQNALLKTLEEPPGEAIIILGVASEDQLLPTVVSRCRVVNLAVSAPAKTSDFTKDIVKLISQGPQERFQFIEKLDKKDEFLNALTAYFREKMLENPTNTKLQVFLQDLIEAEKWAKQNVNIRAILEYLMLKMPS